MYQLMMVQNSRISGMLGEKKMVLRQLTSGSVGTVREFLIKCGGKSNGLDDLCCMYMHKYIPSIQTSLYHHY